MAVLGLTVLAWGNSIGDLVADLSVARAGQVSDAHTRFPVVLSLVICANQLHHVYKRMLTGVF